MAAVKTYLNLVNDVLLELRESAVTTVNYTNYSTLVAKWINDAKRIVEGAWDWQPLNYLVTLTINPNQTTYDLTQLNPQLTERARIRKNPQSMTHGAYTLSFDISYPTPGQLFHMPADWIHEQVDRVPVAITSTRPLYFGLEKYNNGTNTGLQCILWEVPTQTRTWHLYFCNPQADLVNDTDVMYVPWEPVEKIALDYALNERGEELGEPGTTIDQRVQQHLSQAIGIDSIEQEHNTQFWPS